MNSVLFFNASLIFLATCILIGFLIQVLLFVRSKKRFKYRFEFIALFIIFCWQVSMFFSLLANSTTIFFADALSYALGALTAVTLFVLSRHLRGVKHIHWLLIVSACILMIFCVIPGMVIIPSVPTSPAQHVISFGVFAWVYYVYIFVILIWTACNLIRSTQLKSFVNSRGLLFVFCAVVLLNCGLNIALPFAFASFFKIDMPVVNALQAVATGCMSMLFVSYFYTSLAYEYFDTQLSMQKKLVYRVVVIAVAFCIVGVLFFSVYFLHLGFFPFFFICSVLWFFTFKFKSCLEYMLDSYFFFDAFDHQAINMKSIDKKLARTNYLKLVDDVRDECRSVGINPVHFYISFRDQYTLKDIFSKKRISETDPCILGVYHLPGNFFTLDTLCLLRHRYIRSIEKRMKKSKADMLFVCHSGSAVVGCLFFQYPTGMSFSHAQKDVLLNIESRVGAYLSYREALFAAKVGVDIK